MTVIRASSLSRAEMHMLGTNVISAVDRSRSQPAVDSRCSSAQPASPSKTSAAGKSSSSRPNVLA